MQLKTKQTGFMTIIIVLGLLLAVLFAFSTYMLVIRSDSGEQPNQLNTPDSDTLTQEKQDTLKNEQSYQLHGKLLAFSLNMGSYPEASSLGWQSFIESNNNQEPLIDPYTDTEYKFTKSDPDYGEIEYRYPASCDDAQKNFVAPNSTQSYAFRLKYSDGIRCTHSL